MPQDFDRCVKGGGRVRTIKPNANTYIHICNDESGSHTGEVKHNQQHMARGGVVARSSGGKFRSRIPDECK